MANEPLSTKQLFREFQTQAPPQPKAWRLHIFFRGLLWWLRWKGVEVPSHIYAHILVIIMNLS